MTYVMKANQMQHSWHDTVLLSAFIIRNRNICSISTWLPQILHIFGWCTAASALALRAAVGLHWVPPSPPPPWFQPPAHDVSGHGSPHCASAPRLYKHNKRSTLSHPKNTNLHSKMTLFKKEALHPLVLSTSSPFKCAHLCSNVSILWRSCSQASRCLCWEADMVFSSFSRSFSSAISNWSSLLCRWTVEPVRSFKEYFNRWQWQNRTL